MARSTPLPGIPEAIQYIPQGDCVQASQPGVSPLFGWGTVFATAKNRGSSVLVGLYERLRVMKKGSCPPSVEGYPRTEARPFALRHMEICPRCMAV